MKHEAENKLTVKNVQNVQFREYVVIKGILMTVYNGGNSGGDGVNFQQERRMPSAP